MSHVYKLRHSVIGRCLKRYVQNHSQHYLAHIISNLQRAHASHCVSQYQHPTALCHAELGKASVLKPRAPTERSPFSLVLNTYQCMAAATGSPACCRHSQWPGPAACPRTAGLSSLRSCANQNSCCFITVPLFFLEGIEKSERPGSSAPFTFHSQKNPSRQLLPSCASWRLTGPLPAQPHKHKGGRIC